MPHGGSKRQAGVRYTTLVAAGKGVKLSDEALAQQIYLGDAAFIEAYAGAD
jgi:hypothetical protein